MRVGEIFQKDGSYWMAYEVTVEQNKLFRWLKVVAKWSCLGPIPAWANEDRVFLMGKIHIDTERYV